MTPGFFHVEITLQEIFSQDWLLKIFLNGLFVGLMVSLCASLLGVSLVLKRYSMIGDGLSHVGFCAMAISTAVSVIEGSYATGISSVGKTNYTLYISIPLVIIAAFFLLKISESSKIKGDAAIALISTGSLALGFIIYNAATGSTADVCKTLFGSGSPLNAGTRDVMMTIALSAVVIFLFVFFYTKIFAVTFDESFGQATGIKVGTYKMLIALLTALTIVLGMQLMGTIIVSGLVIFPALTAMRVCKTFRGVVIMSAVLAEVCYVIGFVGSCMLDLQAGPSIVMVSIFAFLIFSLIGFVKGKVIRT